CLPSRETATEVTSDSVGSCRLRSTAAGAGGAGATAAGAPFGTPTPAAGLAGESFWHADATSKRHGARISSVRFTAGSLVREVFSGGPGGPRTKCALCSQRYSSHRKSGKGRGTRRPPRGAGLRRGSFGCTADRLGR